MTTKKTLNLKNPADYGFVKIDVGALQPGDYIRLLNVGFTFDHINDMLRVDYVRHECHRTLVQVLAKNHPNIKNYVEPNYTWNYTNREFDCWRKKSGIPADVTKCVIVTNGPTTTAKLYEGNKVVKEAVAKCSPDDEFNLEYGMHLAFHRLIGWGNPTRLTLDSTIREWLEAIKR